MKSNFCSGCGTKIEEGASFCSECGKKVPSMDNANHCSHCGFEYNPEDYFCPECGTGLSSGIIEEKTLESQSQPAGKKKSQRIVKTTTHHVKKKKRGVIRTLGKVALWFFAFLIVATTILYFIGNDSESSYTTEEQLKDRSIESSPEEDLTLPSVQVRQANPVLSNTISFKLLPNSKRQEISFSDSIRVTTPPNFTNKEQSLAISNATVDKAIMVEDAEPLMLVDLTLDDGKQPAKPVEISYTYDKTDLNPIFTAEEQLAAFRWDEEVGGWINLPTRIDENDQKISVLVDHFSITSIVNILNDLAKGLDEHDKLMNSIYTTPEKNFRILYSRDAIEKNDVLYDKAWKSQYDRIGYKYKNDVPRYIQDIGYFLESALIIYANHGKSPAGQENFLYWSYQKSIIVKIDSWFSKVTDIEGFISESLDGKNPLTSKTAGLPSYEKILERLHIPTSNANGPDNAQTTTAHELFHAFQAQYYGASGMMNPLNQWWLESTADFAAFSIAWPAHVNGMYSGLGNNYLSFPVTDRGEKKGQGEGWDDREYEYITSIWIKYLVDIEKFDFKEMIVNDASDILKPIHSLENYSLGNQKLLLGDVYRNFANWMTFSSNSPLKKYSLATFDAGKNQNEFIATHTSKLLLGTNKEIKYTFQLPDHYSSQLWAIKVTKDPLDKKNEKKPILIKSKSKTPGTSLDIFVVAQGERFLTPPKPIKSIYTEDKPAMIFAKPNDLVLVAATQGTLTGGNAEVIVSDVGIILEIDPPELANVVAREANYFTLKAKNIPEEIKTVDFEWNYNDGSEKGIHDFVSVSNGEAQIKISHRYEESDKEEIYPLKVILKEAGKKIVLSEAEALVTLPLAVPELSVTPGISVGPPGATFDLEAKVTPRDTYKFEWKISGFGEGYTQEGEESGIAPVIDEEGEYAVTVKLYDLAGNYLNMAQVSITVEPDELDTKDVDGIVGIDEDENVKPFTHSGYWVLYDTKEINGCQFYESECWPLESCTGGKGSFSITVGSSTCGSNASGKSGSGTYTVPPAKLMPGETLIFKAAASGSGYSRVDVSYYENIKKMSFDEKGHNKGDSPSWNRKIVGCNAGASPDEGEYKIPENNGEEGAILIEGGGSIGSFETKRSYFFLYKWQK